jgi:peptidoglycan/xylan/chitin deacetylase (PgdA/CDA1 family)
VAARRVWLTFDDGPHPENTPIVLEALKQHDVRATFFVVGRMVRNHGQGLLERMQGEGHGIGNHSDTHPRLATLDEAKVRDELKRTDELISKYHGEAKLFRPPFGNYNQAVVDVAESLGYKTIIWSVDPRDWDRQNQPDGWVTKALDLIKDQDEAVVLMHDIARSTAEHVGLFIRQIRGLGPVTFEGAETLWKTPAARDTRRDRPQL